MTEKKGCKCGDPVANGFHGADACEPYKQEEAAPMRTKLEILDTIDALGAECYRSETMLNAEKGLPRVAPGANLIEAMKPFVETLLDLRDAIVNFTDSEDGDIIKAYIVGQLKLQKSDADWRATIVSRLISEIRGAGKMASHLYWCARCDKEGRKKGPPWICDSCKEEIDDAKPGEGDPSGRGRQDRRPQEGGP